MKHFFPSTACVSYKSWHAWLSKLNCALVSSKLRKSNCVCFERLAFLPIWDEFTKTRHNASSFWFFHVRVVGGWMGGVRDNICLEFLASNCHSTSGADNSPPPPPPRILRDTGYLSYWNAYFYYSFHNLSFWTIILEIFFKTDIKVLFARNVSIVTHPYCLAWWRCK